MPSGPVAALLVLALAVLVGGIYLFVELRHHGGAARARERARGGGERLPLFGTDGLVDRAAAPATRARGRGEPARIEPQATRRVTPAAFTRAGAVPLAPPAAPNGPAARPGADFAPPNGIPDAAATRPPAAPPIAPPVAPLRAPARPAPVFADTRGGTLVASAPPAPPSAAPAPAPAAAPRTADESFHDGETIRFSIPDEGTLQFLPGRLEVVAGPDRGREVRFVRTSGDERTEVTFGRSEGPAYRHVQLMARTVSRQHAAMSLIDGHWQLKNMSATNPVLLNGRSLEAGEIAPLLVEGDRIEMGEVVFCFHER